MKKKPLSLVESAAIQWWKARRPSRWTEVQHLSNPTINCTTHSEHVLASHVSGFMLQRRLQQSARATGRGR